METQIYPLTDWARGDYDMFALSLSCWLDLLHVMELGLYIFVFFPKTPLHPYDVQNPWSYIMQLFSLFLDSSPDLRTPSPHPKTTALNKTEWMWKKIFAGIVREPIMCSNTETLVFLCSVSLNYELVYLVICTCISDCKTKTVWFVWLSASHPVYSALIYYGVIMLFI